MKVPFIAVVGLAAGASLGLASMASADLVDNGDGSLTYYNHFPGDDVVGDGLIYGYADMYAEHAGAEILGVGWEDLTVNTGSPLNSYTGDNFWALWMMSGSGGDGWYYGVPFGGESSDSLGPATGGFNLAGAGFTIIADGSMGTGYADVGGSGVLNATMAGYISITFIGEIIPTPGAIALLAIAGIAGKRRRR